MRFGEFNCILAYFFKKIISAKNKRKLRIFEFHKEREEESVREVLYCEESSLREQFERVKYGI